MHVQGPGHLGQPRGRHAAVCRAPTGLFVPAFRGPVLLHGPFPPGSLGPAWKPRGATPVRPFLSPSTRRKKTHSLTASSSHPGSPSCQHGGHDKIHFRACSAARHGILLTQGQVGAQHCVHIMPGQAGPGRVRSGQGSASIASIASITPLWSTGQLTPPSSRTASAFHPTIHPPSTFPDAPDLS